MHANILQSYKNQLSLQKERTHADFVNRNSNWNLQLHSFKTKMTKFDRIFINLSFWTKIKNEAY